MRRRGNKSSKVPNVKLRPAQEGAVPRFIPGDSSVCWAQDSQADGDSPSTLDLCPRPFKGVVICATGVVDKPTLFKQALELGATSVNAFTDRVTHLVAVDHGGAKYMCALERKIPILSPSWITDNYQIWLRGDDVDLEESIVTHRLPIFSRVVLCPSGIADITRRTQINKLLTEHQGVYLKNLERPVRVTHLLCSGDEETEKMRYAEKFNSRGEANVHLVWEEWFWDSLEFGGRFDEAKYQVRHPRPERKSVPEPASSPPPSSAVLSERGEESSSPSNQQPPPKNDEGEEELATVTHVPEVTLQLWGSLLKPRGYQISGGELLRSPSKGPEISKPQSSPTRSPEARAAGGSVISAFRRSNSFAPVRRDPPASLRPQPFRRAMTSAAISSKDDAAGSFMASARPLLEKNGESSTSVGDATPGLFVGLRFRALGEAKSPSVRTAIEQSGGVMVSEGETDSDDDVDYIIVRLASGSKLYRGEPDELQRMKYRTECWLERCIFRGSLCPPEDHISFWPLKIETPVPDAEDITLSFSGFDQSEACWITRLLRALGIGHARFFSRRSTHLLCPSGSGTKFEKAREWGIPVVTMEWLAAVATTGNTPHASEYLVVGTIGRNLRPADEIEIDPKGKRRALDKGKGKELAAVTEGGKVVNGMSVHAEIRASFKPANALQSRAPSQLEYALSPCQPHPGVMSFGQPNEILQPLQRHPSAASTPTRTSPTIDTARPGSHVPGGATESSGDPSHKPTPREIEQERKQARIPSSKSPSPLKIPRGASHASDSPGKISNEVTKALQDSITSLLGKRQPPPSEDDGAPPGAARVGKRARPQRPKPQSRQPSHADLSEISAVPVTAYGESASPFGSYDSLTFADDNEGEESMRVTYEDPDQRDEKEKLMNLLKGDDVSSQLGGGSTGQGNGAAMNLKGSRSTRRSTRIAGF